MRRVYVFSSLHRNGASTGILTCWPSTTPFGFALGPDWPWTDYRCSGNLRLSANRFLACFIVTYAYICFSNRSNSAHATSSTQLECSPTDCIATIPKLRYYVWCPSIVHAQPLDQWAVTHSLNEWLLPSKHPGCQCSRTSLYQLNIDLGTLAVGLSSLSLVHGP